MFECLRARTFGYKLTLSIIMNHNGSLLLNLSFHLIESSIVFHIIYNIIEQVVSNNRNENNDSGGGGVVEHTIIFSGVNMLHIDYQCLN